MEQIWQLLLQNGVTSSEISLIQHSYLIIVMIPIVTTILAVLRYIIGVRSPNISVVLILTFVFLELSFQNNLNENFVQGLKYGTLLYFIVFATATISYALIKKFRMHYIPKMSIVFISICIAYILLIILTRATGTALLLVSNSFMLVITAILAENIATSFARKDLKYSIDLSIRTYIVGVLCFIIASLDIIRNLLLNYPYLLILVLILNIYIGNFKGLRITEYFRFKSILFSTSSDEQTKSNSKK